jgi:probable phosphoglycerate mutase
VTSPLTKIPFWYLRHGQTDWNAKDLSQGNVDIPLNDVGRQQARDAAVRLNNRGIRSIVASPLSRAYETAQIVGEVLGLPVSHTVAELREVSFGVQEGKEMGDWFHAWNAGSFTPEGAEPFAELRRRAVIGLNTALQADAPVLIVAHGAVFRALRAEMGLDSTIRMKNAEPTFCQPVADGWELTGY